MCGNRSPNVFSIAQYKSIWNRWECQKHLFIFNRKIWNTIFKVMVEFPGYILFVTSFGKLAAPLVYPIQLIYFPGETIKTNTPACVPWLCHMVSASWALFNGNFLCVNDVWYKIKHRCIQRIVSLYFISGIFFLYQNLSNAMLEIYEITYEYISLVSFLTHVSIAPHTFCHWNPAKRRFAVAIRPSIFPSVEPIISGTKFQLLYNFNFKFLVFQKNHVVDKCIIFVFVFQQTSLIVLLNEWCHQSGLKCLHSTASWRYNWLNYTFLS